MSWERGRRVESLFIFGKHKGWHTQKWGDVVLVAPRSNRTSKEPSTRYRRVVLESPVPWVDVNMDYWGYWDLRRDLRSRGKGQRSETGWQTCRDPDLLGCGPRIFDRERSTSSTWHCIVQIYTEETYTPRFLSQLHGVTVKKRFEEVNQLTYQSTKQFCPY